LVLSFSLRSTSSPSVASSEPRVDLRPLGLVEHQLREPALVVDRHRGAVLDRALDVVHADVVAEHRPRVGILQLDRGAGEADEGRMGQRITHVPREAVDEVVLAAVRLVGDHDDVAAVGQHRLPVALLLGEELLDRGEDHAPRRDGKLLPQVGSAFGLHRRLAQEVLAAREGAEELIVEVVAVGEHDQRRVLHRRLAHDPAGIERHGQALAGALGVPDDADPSVTRLAPGLFPRLVTPSRLRHRAVQLGRPQRLADGHLDRVELVVAGHLLRELAAARVLEHDEVADEVEESLFLEQPFDRHLQLGQVRIGELLARDRAPRLHPLAPGRERADPRLDAVGREQHFIEREQRRQLGLVGLELLERRPDGRVLVGRVLELHHRQRQPVDEQHHVRPARVLVLGDGELIDREPVVVLRIVEVERARLRPADRAVCCAVLDRHTLHQQAMHGTVAGRQLRAFGTRQPTEGIVHRFGRKCGIEPLQRVAQARFQYNLRIVRAFGSWFARWDFESVRDPPAEALEPREGSLFDDGFGEGRRHRLTRSTWPSEWIRSRQAAGPYLDTV
jgi:hypothetical protein